MIGIASAVLEVDISEWGTNNTFIFNIVGGGNVNGSDINVSGILLNGTFVDDWDDIQGSGAGGSTLWEEDGEYIKPQGGKKVKVENEVLVNGDFKVNLGTGGAYVRSENGNIAFQLG